MQWGKYKKRKASFLSAGLFIFNTIAWSAPVSLEIKHSSLAEELMIPESLGRIEERYTPPQILQRIDAPTVVHIQDPHASYEGQIQIKEILRHLRENYKFNLILLEGGGGPLHPDLMNFFDDSSLNKEVADSLAKESEIGGPELFLMNQTFSPQSQEKILTHEVQGHGVENEILYWKNLSDFREVIRQKEIANAFLNQIKESLHFLSSHSLNPRLREFLKGWMLYRNSKTELLRHLSALRRSAKEELGLDLTDPLLQGEWPQLSRFFQLRKTEKQISPRETEREKEKLILWLESKNINKEFVERIKAFESQKEPRKFLEKFYEETEPLGFRFKDYPLFSLFLAFITLRREIEIKALFWEIEKLTEEILQKLAQTKEEKNLILLFCDFLLLRKLFSLELMREEFDRVQKASSRFLPSRYVERVSWVGGGKVQFNFSSLSALDLLFRKAILFYEGTKDRDEAMIQNTLERMREEKENRAVLITGGFHSHSLLAHLRSRGIAYVEISPKISEAGETTAYLKTLMAESAIKSALYLSLDQTSLEGSLQKTRTETRRYQKRKIKFLLAKTLSSIAPSNLQADDRAGMRRTPIRVGTLLSLHPSSARAEMRTAPFKAPLDDETKKGWIFKMTQYLAVQQNNMLYEYLKTQGRRHYIPYLRAQEIKDPDSFFQDFISYFYLQLLMPNGKKQKIENPETGYSPKTASNTPEAYLNRVIRNSLVDFLRQTGRQNRFLRQSPFDFDKEEREINLQSAPTKKDIDILDLVIEEETKGRESALYAKIIDFLSELPEKQRRIFEAHRLGGKTFEEIATEFHLHVSSAKYFDAQARTRIRNQFHADVEQIAAQRRHRAEVRNQSLISEIKNLSGAPKRETEEERKKRLVQYESAILELLHENGIFEGQTLIIPGAGLDILPARYAVETLVINEKNYVQQAIALIKETLGKESSEIYQEKLRQGQLKYIPPREGKTVDAREVDLYLHIDPSLKTRKKTVLLKGVFHYLFKNNQAAFLKYLKMLHEKFLEPGDRILILSHRDTMVSYDSLTEKVVRNVEHPLVRELNYQRLGRWMEKSLSESFQTLYKMSPPNYFVHGGQVFLPPTAIYLFEKPKSIPSTESEPVEVRTEIHHIDEIKEFLKNHADIHPRHGLYFASGKDKSLSQILDLFPSLEKMELVDPEYAHLAKVTPSLALSWLNQGGFKIKDHSNDYTPLIKGESFPVKVEADGGSRIIEIILKGQRFEDYPEGDERPDLTVVKYPGEGGDLAFQKDFWQKVISLVRPGGWVLVHWANLLKEEIEEKLELIFRKSSKNPWQAVSYDEWVLFRRPTISPSPALPRGHTFPSRVQIQTQEKGEPYWHKEDIQLILDFVQKMQGPRLILIGGGAGSGKSTLARELRDVWKIAPPEHFTEGKHLEDIFKAVHERGKDREAVLEVEPYSVAGQLLKEEIEKEGEEKEKFKKYPGIASDYFLTFLMRNQTKFFPQGNEVYVFEYFDAPQWTAAFDQWDPLGEELDPGFLDIHVLKVTVKKKSGSSQRTLISQQTTLQKERESYLQSRKHRSRSEVRVGSADQGMEAQRSTSDSRGKMDLAESGSARRSTPSTLQTKKLSSTVESIFAAYRPELRSPVDTVIAVSNQALSGILPIPVIAGTSPILAEAIFARAASKALLKIPMIGALKAGLKMPITSSSQNTFGIFFVPSTPERVEELYDSLLVVNSEYKHKLGVIVVEGEISSEAITRLNQKDPTGRLRVVATGKNGYSKILLHFFQGNWGRRLDAETGAAFKNLFQFALSLAKKSGIREVRKIGDLFQYASVVGGEDLVQGEDQRSLLKWRLIEKDIQNADRLLTLGVLSIYTAGLDSLTHPEFLQSSFIQENLHVEGTRNFLASLRDEAPLLNRIDWLRREARALATSA